MILGIMIGVAGLVAVALAYVNRDDLKGPLSGRELAI